jgi:hypothetical protein
VHKIGQKNKQIQRRIKQMTRIFVTLGVVLALLLIGALNIQAQQKPLSVTEFRKLYDSLLAGKTLVAETKENGMVIRKERTLAKAIDTGDSGFEVPVNVVITKTKDGKLDEKITVNILDRVNDLGGQAIVSEEIRRTTVEKPGSGPQTTREVEFGGLFRVASNEKGGFDAHNFGLMPSVVADEKNSTSLTGSMVSYSCFPEKGITKCVLTIREYKLGDYKPLVGYTLGGIVGKDSIEIAEQVHP